MLTPVHERGNARKTIYFVDDNQRKQGEYTVRDGDGKLLLRCIYIDGLRYGESKTWWWNDAINEHCFCDAGNVKGELRTYTSQGELRLLRFMDDGTDVTNTVRDIVEDLYNITDEENVILKLKYGTEFKLCKDGI